MTTFYTGSRGVVVNAWSDTAREAALAARQSKMNPKDITDPPIGSAHDTVHNYLKQMAGFREVIKKSHPEFKYTGMADLVMKEGQDYQAGPRPEGVHQGKMKLCFQNAFELMQSNPERYVYAEGFATTSTLKNTGLAFDHAFCIDTKTGLVADPTWKDGEGYRGIPLKSKYVLKTILAKKTYGVLDNMQQHQPIMLGQHKIADIVEPRGCVKK